MSQTVQAGVAITNITPSVGQDNVGDYRRLVPAEGVGNELYAKALVLDDGEKRAAIVTADVIGFAGTVVEDTRARIEKLTGIPGARVVLSASHTHSSPATTQYDCAAQEYLTELAKKAAGAVYTEVPDWVRASISRFPRGDGGSFSLYGWIPVWLCWHVIAHSNGPLCLHYSA